MTKDMAMFEPIVKLEHADSRGEIYSITLPGDKELMLLRSNPGVLRGGHSHDVDEVVVMLTGKMKYYKKEKEGNEWNEELRGGETSFNPRGEYHMGEMLEETWLLEWKIDTKKGDWVNIDYQPWRAQVQDNAR